MNKEELKETLEKLETSPQQAEIFMTDRIWDAVDVCRSNPDKDPTQFSAQLSEIGMSVLSFEGHMDKIRRETQSPEAMDSLPRSGKAWLARHIDEIKSNISSSRDLKAAIRELERITMKLTENTGEGDIFALFVEEIEEDYIQYNRD